MAVNPNPSLPNRNTLYLGRSGSGKSQALLQRSGIPARGARVLLLDPNHDHPCHRIKGYRRFAVTVAAAIQSGRGFRLALDETPCEETLEAFSRVVLTALDGNHLTFTIIEELSGWSAKVGKAPPWTARMINEGRKFGLVFHGTTQKPQNISKDFYEQCAVRWVGMQKTSRQKKLLAEELGVSVADIDKLKPLQFWHDLDDGNPPKLVALDYRKPPHHR